MIPTDQTELTEGTSFLEPGYLPVIAAPCQKVLGKVQLHRKDVVLLQVVRGYSQTAHEDTAAVNGGEQSHLLNMGTREARPLPTQGKSPQRPRRFRGVQGPPARLLAGLSWSCKAGTILPPEQKQKHKHT